MFRVNDRLSELQEKRARSVAYVAVSSLWVVISTPAKDAF
jgi:hypothetical protein